MKKTKMYKTNKLSFLCLIVATIVCVSCSDKTVAPDDSNPIGEFRDTTFVDVSYGSHTRQKYDIHLPARRNINTPVILMIHGGAWIAGQKEDFNQYIELIKSRWNSVAIVTMNYRYASTANKIHHAEIMADIASVVEHLSTNTTKYQISKNIGVIGASAGAHLAMIYAYKYNSNIKCVGDIFGPTIFNDWEWYNAFNLATNTKTGDILAEYVGKMWDTTAYKAVSPYWNVSSTTQPTIIFHGSLDPVVPVYHSQWHYNKLKALNVPTQYHEYIAFHSFDNTQSNDVMNKLVAFFQLYLK